MTLSQIIRKRRRELEFSQSRLADLVEATRGSVQLWESGKTPSVQHIAKLEKALRFEHGQLYDLLAKKSR